MEYWGSILNTGRMHVLYGKELGLSEVSLHFVYLIQKCILFWIVSLLQLIFNVGISLEVIRY